jgi:3-deoxy-7-phosphoheptulonate synthase
VPRPAELLARFPLEPAAALVIQEARQRVAALVAGSDERLLCVVGPCSIHDPDSALEYARRLAPLAERHAAELMIVMRVYLEKPRGSVGCNLSAYFCELLTWAAIGARTTESQPHRELASALPFGVGFKNGTDGRIDGALGGMKSAAQPHRRLAPDAHGRLHAATAARTTAIRAVCAQK